MKIRGEFWGFLVIVFAVIALIVFSIHVDKENLKKNCLPALSLARTAQDTIMVYMVNSRCVDVNK